MRIAFELRSSASAVGALLLPVALAGCPDESPSGTDTQGPETGTSATGVATSGGAGGSSTAGGEATSGDPAATTSTGEWPQEDGCSGKCEHLATCEDSVDNPIDVQGQSALGPFVAVRAYAGLYLCCGCELTKGAGMRSFFLLNEGSGPYESCDIPAPDPAAASDLIEIKVPEDDRAFAHCGDAPWLGATFEVTVVRRTAEDPEVLEGHTLSFDGVSGVWDHLDPTQPPRFAATLAGPNFAGSFVASLCDCFNYHPCGCE